MRDLFNKESPKGPIDKTPKTRNGKLCIMMDSAPTILIDIEFCEQCLRKNKKLPQLWVVMDMRKIFAIIGVIATITAILSISVVKGTKIYSCHHCSKEFLQLIKYQFRKIIFISVETIDRVKYSSNLIQLA